MQEVAAQWRLGRNGRYPPDSRLVSLDGAANGLLVAALAPTWVLGGNSTPRRAPERKHPPAARVCARLVGTAQLYKRGCW